MLLADIGNTTVHFGIEREGKIHSDFRMRNTELSRTYIRRLLRKEKEIFLCSVAPSVTSLFKRSGARIIEVGKDIAIPIRCRYNRREVGGDRLVNAFAARCLYPGIRLIVDFGTAITIDILSAKGVYEGGIILPGITLYLRSLEHCELLKKKITLKKVRGDIPRDTASSISKGIGEGFSIMINGFILKYLHLLCPSRKNTSVVVTGGESRLLTSMLRFPYLHDPLLTLKGLLLLKNKLKGGTTR